MSTAERATPVVAVKPLILESSGRGLDLQVKVSAPVAGSELDVLEASVPGLAGRLDRSRIAVAGHSFGASRPETSSASACSTR